MILRKVGQISLLAAILVFGLFEARFLFQNTVFHWRVLRESGFDYQRIKESMTGTSAARRARQVLPPDAKIELSPATWDIEAVALRYELYPVEIRPHGDFVLDRDPSRSRFPADWPKQDLAEGLSLYAKPGQAFVDNPLSTPPQNVGVIALTALGILLFQTTVGYVLFQNLSLPLRGQGLTSAVGTWYLSGSLLLNLLLWGYLWGGGHVTRASVASIWALTLGILVLIPRIKHPAPPETTPPSPRSATTILSHGPALVIVLAIFFCAISLPVNNWDAMSHWVMKAKVIFHQGRLDLGYTHSNYYPLLWPLHIAAQFALVGSTADPLARWASGFFFLAMVSQLWGGLSLLRLRPQEKSAAVCLCLLSFFHDPLKGWWSIQFTFAHAENIFLAYTAATVVSLLILIKNPLDRRVRLQVMLMATGLAASKMEGGASLVLIILALTLSAKNDGSWLSELRRDGSFLLPLLIPLGWIWWTRVQGYFSEFYHLRYPVDLEKMRVLGSVWAKHLPSSSTPFLLFFALVSVKLFGQRRSWSRQERFLLTAGMLLSLFVLIAFMGWPGKKIVADFEDVSSRLFLHAVLPAGSLLWAGRLWGRDPG